MFKILSNIFSQSDNDASVLQATPDVKKIHSERSSRPSRVISVRGKTFGVGLARAANVRNRFHRLSTLQVGEEMCFLEKPVTMHKAVKSYRKSWEGQNREYIINPATLEGARIPSQEVSVVTRTA